MKSKIIKLFMFSLLVFILILHETLQSEVLNERKKNKKENDIISDMARGVSEAKKNQDDNLQSARAKQEKKDKKEADRERKEYKEKKKERKRIKDEEKQKKIDELKELENSYTRMIKVFKSMKKEFNQRKDKINQGKKR
mmetsp:Transcript_42209/g.44191  ORF Transcript_42209/g.44191 Transcript_42209/m.44191 type:complete len:139 (+) Transcript_42209:13-429(+)